MFTRWNVNKNEIIQDTEHTSLSGTVLCCFRRKSKSFPSQYSRTVQNLKVFTNYFHINSNNSIFNDCTKLNSSKHSLEHTVVWCMIMFDTKFCWLLISITLSYLRVLSNLKHIIKADNPLQKRTSTIKQTKNNSPSKASIEHIFLNLPGDQETCEYCIHAMRACKCDCKTMSLLFLNKKKIFLESIQGLYFQQIIKFQEFSRV